MKAKGQRLEAKKIRDEAIGEIMTFKL